MKAGPKELITVSATGGPAAPDRRGRVLFLPDWIGQRKGAARRGLLVGIPGNKISIYFSFLFVGCRGESDLRSEGNWVCR